MNSLLDQIKNRLEHLSDAERIVGNYIIKYPENVPNMTAKDLSGKTGVSPASVIRFFKSIGAASFKNFKLELVKELTLSESDLTDFSILQKKDSPYELFCKVTRLNKNAIESTRLSLERKKFEKAVSVLKNADKITFFGVGGSSTTERKTGSITIDNQLYGRYQGEIQIVKKDLCADTKVNVVGHVIETDLPLLSLIHGGDAFQIK